LKAYSVIVAYQPDTARLLEMTGVLRDNGLGVIVVDNSEPPAELELGEGIEVIALNENLGIAAAQNIGIRRALEEGSDAIVFFDQDSRIQPELLMTLLQAIDILEPRIVAPVFFDEKRGFEYPAIRVDRWGLRTKVRPSTWGAPAPVDIIISSGSAANRAALDTVGLMDEALFIDHVDTEWCLRARSRGIPIEVLPQARMLHSIGDDSINLRIARVPVHSAYRRYYRVRNALLLLGMPHVPKLLALREVIFTFVHQGIILLAVPGRRQYLRYFFKAVIDGVCGKKGKMQ